MFPRSVKHCQQHLNISVASGFMNKFTCNKTIHEVGAMQGGEVSNGLYLKFDSYFNLQIQGMCGWRLWVFFNMCALCRASWEYQGSREPRYVNWKKWALAISQCFHPAFSYLFRALFLSIDLALIYPGSVFVFLECDLLSVHFLSHG